MELHNLKPADGSHRDRKRVGRGPGSGKGKTSGRGEKGQNARSGGGVAPYFEGGQMPLQRRIPKRGFTPRSRREYQVVNVGDLAFVSGEITPESLEAAGLVRSAKRPVKILGSGEASRALTCSVHAISGGARSKIIEAGGSVTLLAGSGGDVEAREAPAQEATARDEEE
ncbi:MAG: 50S ribosomal protein L15 [Gemmatimonadetes bacterium]|nr:50S ribosomal protein L15 [Gemmatimonadota bacterium]